MRKHLFHGDSISLKKDYEFNLVFYLLGLKCKSVFVFKRGKKRNTLANQQGELVLEPV